MRNNEGTVTISSERFLELIESEKVRAAIENNQSILTVYKYGLTNLLPSMVVYTTDETVKELTSKVISLENQISSFSNSASNAWKLKKEIEDKYNELKKSVESKNKRPWFLRIVKH